MRTIIFILFVALIGLQYKLWLGDGGILHWQGIEKKILAQTKTNKKLENRNHSLEANIHELKNGDQALEEEARFELGMVQNDETYYQFLD